MKQHKQLYQRVWFQIQDDLMVTGGEEYNYFSRATEL